VKLGHGYDERGIGIVIGIQLRLQIYLDDREVYMWMEQYDKSKSTLGNVVKVENERSIDMERKVDVVNHKLDERYHYLNQYGLLWNVYL
jgi:hypothetical protein